MMTPFQLEFTKYLRELGTLSRRDVTQGIKLAKYKKAAQSLLKTDPSVGNTLLGLVACLEHDLASMHVHHKRAIAIGESCFSLRYYAHSLEMCCLWNEAVKYGLLALDYEPDNLQLLDSVIALVPLTGRFSLLKRLLSHWETAHQGAPHLNQGHSEFVHRMLSGIGLLEKDLKDLLLTIGEAFSETELILQRAHYEIVQERHNNTFLHYRFAVADTLDASYYEDLIAARLEGAFHHPRCFEIFSFSVENSSVYELYQQMEKELKTTADALCVPDPDKMRLIEELVAGVELR